MNLKHIGAVAVVAFILPFATSALSIDDIQAQINRLLAQVAELQEQLRTLGDPIASTTPTIVRPLPPIRCPDIRRVLYRGVSGDDVSSLQEFLSVPVTGYFGTMTEAAIQQAQTQEGIATSGTPGTTGYGAVGSKTRAWILRRCGGGNGLLSATPTYGPAPLTVVFTVREVAGGPVSESIETIDFGDGSKGSDFSGGCAEGAGNQIRFSCKTMTHTYSQTGTFTARLIPTPFSNVDNSHLARTTGTATINVGSTSGGASINVPSPTSGTNVAQGGTLGISWNSQNDPAGSVVGLWLMKRIDDKPVACAAIYPPDPNCGFTNVGLIAGGQSTSGSYRWNVPIPRISPSDCGAGSSAYDCIQEYAASMPQCPLDTPSVCGDRITAGSYKIVAKIYTPASACLGGLCWPNSAPTYLASSESGVFTIGGETKPSGGVPTISGLDAPTSLSVGASGTWTVRVANPVGNLNYSVVWGDEVPMAYDTMSSAMVMPPSRPQATATFTHAYQSAGTFSPTFTVSNSSGSAKTSASVTVGQVGCSGACAPTFFASPTSGNAPLTVSFYEKGGNVASVDFGDGQTVEAPLLNLNSSWEPTHIYMAPGTYTAKLRRIPGPTEANCYGNNCWVIGTVTITVNGYQSSSCSGYEDTSRCLDASSQGASANVASAAVGLSDVLKKISELLKGFAILQ